MNLQLTLKWSLASEESFVDSASHDLDPLAWDLKDSTEHRGGEEMVEGEG